MDNSKKTPTELRKEIFEKLIQYHANRARIKNEKKIKVK